MRLNFRSRSDLVNFVLSNEGCILDDIIQGDRHKKQQFGLTPKQSEVLGFVDTFQKKNMHSPSYRQIVEATSVSSISQIGRMLTELKEQGYIRSKVGKARSIMVIHEGENA